jgi:hypothetical protein
MVVRLDYVRGPGTESCPDERGLRGAIAGRLGYDPAQPASLASASLPTLRVSVARQDGGFVARAEKRNSAGRVEWTRPALTDADCRHLIGVLGLSIAITLDPGASGMVTPATPEPARVEPPTPSPTAPAVDRASPPLPAPLQRPNIRLGVRAGVAGGAGPSPAATLAADIGVRGAAWSVSLEGRADLPATASVDTGAKLRTSVLAAALVPCGHWWWLAGCGIVSLGTLRAESVNLAHGKDDSGLYAAAGLRAGLEWPIPSLPRLALRLSGEGLVTLRPVTARRSDDGRAVWKAPPVAGLLGAGAVVHF